MNINEGKASSTALAAKTARPCDSCLIKRARWFCAADDAFLCQSCDAAVHSANQLASRHQRLRLEASSCKLTAPAWHQGFTKKARTPRQPKARQPDIHQLPLVPEMGSEDPTFPEENEEDQLLFCRVPVFDPYEGSINVFDDDHGDLNLDELLSGCDEELAEFAADVEGLLGSTTGVEEVSMMDEKRVKVEEKEEMDDDDEEVGAVIACHLDPALDMELSWEFNDSESTKKNDEKGIRNSNEESSSSEEKKRMLQLRLNYEAVIAAWAAQGSPWADGIRPQLKQLEDEFMMMGAWLDRDGILKVGGRGGDAAGREARVSRYREKRRTRLFSKKIRYEVRKLNAEKRPRMKGRFVKRTPFFTSSTSSPYH